MLDNYFTKIHLVKNTLYMLPKFVVTNGGSFHELHRSSFSYFILLPIIAAIISGGISIHGVHLVRHIIAQVSAIGMLIGLVIMLGNTSDPDSLGPAFAVMLLVLLYGTIVYGLATALLNTKPDSPVSSQPPYRRAIACAVFLVTLAGAIGNNLSAFVDAPSIIFLTLSLIILYAILKATKSETISRHSRTTCPMWV